MTRWIFIRHGESIANREGWLSGQRDVALSVDGYAQAQRAAKALFNYDFTYAYASDLSRAADTARLILTGRSVELQLTPLLRERACGRFEGTSYADAKASHLAETLQSL